MAAQLTIRGIDPALDRRLREVASHRGQSLNQAALSLLRQAAGLGSQEAGEGEAEDDEMHDLVRFAGTWTKDEADEFDRALAEIRRIDDELWP